jgi:hypothetical protein
MASQSDLELIDGEVLVASLQTEMYAQPTNIIVNIIAKIIAAIATLFGCKRWGKLTITNRRVVIEQHQKMLYCFDAKATFSTLMPTAIASVDYGFVAQLLCFCPKYMFAIATNSGVVYGFVLKGGRNQAMEITNATLNTLLSNR